MPGIYLFYAATFTFFIAWLTPALSDSEVYVCKVDGVATFQSEPCQELLDGKEETENAQYKVVDTHTNTIASPNAVSSNLVQRARNLEYYQYQQQQKHNFDNSSYYIPQPKPEMNEVSPSSDIARKAKANSSACESYQNAAKNYQRAAKAGYSSGASNYKKEQRRQIQQGIDANCK